MTVINHEPAQADAGTLEHDLLAAGQIPATVADAFGPFIRDDVRRALSGHDLTSLGPAFEGALYEHVTGEASHIWFRVLLEEFHRFREEGGWPLDPTSNDAFVHFATALQESTCTTAIRGRWPVPASLVDTRTGLAVANVSHLAKAWAHDRSRLAAANLVPSDAVIDSIAFGAGDSHNGGQTVAILKTRTGERLVFKPRPATTDWILRDLLDAMQDASGVDLGPCCPVTVESDFGSWQEFMEVADLPTAADPDDYFERFGVLVALFTAIGAGDLHHENILTRGEYPCVVDSETLLQPGLAHLDGHLGDELTLAGEHSPGSTLMLPIRVRTGAFDVFVCALGVPWEQNSQKETFDLAHDGTNAVQMVRKRVNIHHTSNLVRQNGNPLNPYDHIGALTRGYLKGHRAIANHLDAFTRILERATAARFRVVLRPTEVYAKFVDAGAQTTALASEEARTQLLGRLRDLEHNDNGRVSAAERRDLGRLDVPAFYCLGDSRRIEWSSGPVSDDFFSQSPTESALSTLTRFAAKSSSYHRFTLETSLNELAVGLGRSYPDPLLQEALVPDPSQAFEEFTKLFQETSIRGTDGNGRAAVGWLSHLGHDTLATFEMDMAMTLHDGGGLASMLHHRRPDLDLSRQALNALALRQPVPTDATISYSAFAGPACAVITQPSPKALPAVPTAWPTAVPANQVDVMGGLSGLVLAACQTSAPPGWIEQAHDALRAARTRTAWERPFGNLAHGELGLLWALHRSGSHLQTDTASLRREIVQGLSRMLEDRTYGPSWCSGAAGGLVVLTDLHVSGAVVPDELVGELARLAAAMPPGQVDLSVCHGVAGVVQAFLRASETGLLPHGRELALDLWHEAVRRAATDGVCTGVPGRTTIMGYFLGWAGVADAVARLAWGPTAFDPTSAILASAPVPAT